MLNGGKERNDGVSGEWGGYNGLGSEQGGEGGCGLWIEGWRKGGRVKETRYDPFLASTCV